MDSSPPKKKRSWRSNASLTVFDELVLMPEPLARRRLAGSALRLRVLAPLGAYAGNGTLRVLRVTPQTQGDRAVVELICGYESYQPL